MVDELKPKEVILPDAVLSQEKLEPATVPVEDQVQLSQEQARTKLALRLTWALIGFLALVFVTAWISPGVDHMRNPADPNGALIAVPSCSLRESAMAILTQAFAPLITLLGTVAGFYFGAKKSS